MYICVCQGITEDEVRQRANSDCFTFAHYYTMLKAGEGCCKCLPKVKELIYEEKRKARAEGDSSPRTS